MLEPTNGPLPGINMFNSLGEKRDGNNYLENQWKIH